MHAYMHAYMHTYIHIHIMHTALAFALRQPAPVLAAGATTATFKINTLEGVKGDVVFELYPDKVHTCCVYECIRICCVYECIRSAHELKTKYDTRFRV
jgi:hypothetical protein